MNKYYYKQRFLLPQTKFQDDSWF